MQSERHPDPAVRRAVRVRMMVHELQELGYQRLRIAPGISPSGAYWRCAVTHIGNILSTHDALLHEWDCDTAHYTSESGGLTGTFVAKEFLCVNLSP
jgi:hypothetical protein